jgi:hypothetical protein
MKTLVILLTMLSILQSNFSHADTIVFVGDGNSCKPFLGEQDTNIRPDDLLDYLNTKNNLWSIIRSEKSIHFCGQEAADKYYSSLLKNKINKLAVAEFLLSSSVIIPFDGDRAGISSSVAHEENYKLGRAFLLQNSLNKIDADQANNNKPCEFIENYQINKKLDDNKLEKAVTLVFPYDYLLISKINNCAAKIYAIKKDEYMTSMGNRIPLLINETLLLYIFEEGNRFEFYMNEFLKKLNYSGNIIPAFRLNEFTKRIVFFETHWDLASKGNQEVILKTMEQHIKQFNANNPSATKCFDNKCLILHFLLDSMHHWISFKKQETQNSLSSTDLNKYIGLAKEIRSTAMSNTIYISEINRLSILEQAIYDYGLKNRLFNNQKYADFYTSIIEHGFGMKVPDCFQSNCFKVIPAIQDYYLHVADSNSLLKKEVEHTLKKLKKQQCKGMRSLHAHYTDGISFGYPCETILEPIKPSTPTISGEKEE